MTSRIQSLISALRLVPHPEGGHYAEVFRSEGTVIAGERTRPALTVIYFLLAAGEHSRWHRVASDEAWVHLEGGPLELLMVGEQSRRLERHVLGPVGPDAGPLFVVPAGVWQAARPLGGYSLVSCMVGPGFDFSDFTLAAREPDAVRLIRGCGPEMEKWL